MEEVFMDNTYNFLIDKYIAHRGFHNEENPENTIGAFERAIEKFLSNFFKKFLLSRHLHFLFILYQKFFKISTLLIHELYYNLRGTRFKTNKNLAAI